MSFSSDLVRWYEGLEARGELPALFNNYAVLTLVETPTGEAFTAKLTALPAAHRLIVLLRSLAEQKRSLGPRLLDAELVVTFPDTESIGARHTLHVVRQMISAAKSEILLAGYAMTTGGGVAEQLVEATRRGVKITLVCSTWKDREGRTSQESVLTDWPERLPRPAVYVYLQRPAGGSGMHAKCLLIDGAEMLIGSANFTFSGLNSNLELGLRIRGAVATEARAVFEDLLRAGHLNKDDRA